MEFEGRFDSEYIKDMFRVINIIVERNEVRSKDLKEILGPLADKFYPDPIDMRRDAQKENMLIDLDYFKEADQYRVYAEIGGAGNDEIKISKYGKILKLSTTHHIGFVVLPEYKNTYTKELNGGVLVLKFV